MADLAQLERALVNADRAGDTEAAKMLATEIKRLRQPQTETAPDPTAGMSGTEKFFAGAGAAAARGARGVRQLTSQMARGAAGLAVETGHGPTGVKVSPEKAQRLQETEQQRVSGIQAEEEEARREEAPLQKTWPGFLGNIAGNVGMALPATLIPGANTALGASLIGGGLGAAQPTLEGESRTTNTLLGGLFGLGGQTLGRGISKAVSWGKGRIAEAAARKAQVPKKVPELDELRTLANQAYTKAENAGLVVSKNSFQKSVNTIREDIIDEGLDPTLHPKATAALKRLVDASGKPLSLREIDTLRRVVRGVARSVEPDERRIARIMIDKLDDYVSGLKRSDVVVGKNKIDEATDALNEARGLWSRFRKGEAVEDLITKAKNRASQFSGSGYENALRTEFRKLAQNPKRMRLFTTEEQKAIQRVARGGPIENTLRFLGKFAPTGTISTLLGGGAGYAVGGPVGSAALLGAGAAGRAGAKALTSRNARIASELMRSGGNLPPNLPLLARGTQLLKPLDNDPARRLAQTLAPAAYFGSR